MCLIRAPAFRCDGACASDLFHLAELAPSLTSLDVSWCGGVTSAALERLPPALRLLAAKGLVFDVCLGGDEEGHGLSDFAGGLDELEATQWAGWWASGKRLVEIDLEGCPAPCGAVVGAMLGASRVRVAGCAGIRGKGLGDALGVGVTHLDIGGCSSLDGGSRAARCVVWGLGLLSWSLIYADGSVHAE